MIPLKDNMVPRRFPIVTFILISFNVLIFCYELTLGTDLLSFFNRFAIVPTRFFAGGHEDIFGQWHGYNLFELCVPLFTSMFLHGGWLHIIANMLYLWVFGDNVEDRLGSLRFLLFYIFCGIFAASAHLIMNSDSQIPSLGASGAVAGVLGAYMLLFPRARVLTIIPIFFILQFFELPAFFFIGIWVLQQFLSGALTLSSAIADTGGIAWWAHIGGFIAGLALALFLKRIKVEPKSRTEARPVTAGTLYLPTSASYSALFAARSNQPQARWRLLG